MLLPVGPLARIELGKIGGLHFQNVVNHVGPITEADLDVHMAEAARIHAREWNATSHPLDGTIPDQAHTWAIRHIAANLVARERGYDVGAVSYRLPAPKREDTDLQPAARTGDWNA